MVYRMGVIPWKSRFGAKLMMSIETILRADNKNTMWSQNHSTNYFNNAMSKTARLVQHLREETLLLPWKLTSCPSRMTISFKSCTAGWLSSFLWCFAELFNFSCKWFSKRWACLTPGVVLSVVTKKARSPNPDYFVHELADALNIEASVDGINTWAEQVRKAKMVWRRSWTSISPCVRSLFCIVVWGM